MKIFPLRLGVAFHPSLIFLSVSIKRCEKITKEDVDRGVAHSTYYITKQPLAHMIYVIIMDPPIILLRWRSSGRGIPPTQIAIYKQVAVSW